MQLMRQRTVWLPTWQGALLVAALSGVVFAGILFGAYPFLARTAPVDAELLVVEGWMPDYALREAVNAFRSGGYRALAATGGPLAEGSILADYGSWAEVAAATAIRMGVEEARVIVAPAPPSYRKRTIQAAISLRDALAADCVEIEALNLYTLGAHARRSQLAYQRVFGPDVEVGVVAIPAVDYDPNRWWTSSHGLKRILWEATGWFYTWLDATDYAPAPDGSATARCSSPTPRDSPGS